MKKLIAGLIALGLITSLHAISFAGKYESETLDAASVVLYGYNGTDLKPLAVAADGTVLISGGSATANDTAYGASWNGSTTQVPSQNSVYDRIEDIVAGGGEASTVANSASINFTLIGSEISGVVNTTLQGIWNNKGTSNFTNGTDITVGNLTVNSDISINSTSSAQKLDLGVGAIRFNPLTIPTAPTPEVNATAGNLNGTYYYRISYVNGIGETGLGTVSNGVECANQTMNLTNISVSTDPSVTSRKIYRARTTSNSMYSLATISNNVDTTYIDNIADADLDTTRSNDRPDTSSSTIYVGTTTYAILGSSNNAIGNAAGDSITVGISNVLFGTNAGTNLTKGTNNIAIGANALDGATSALYNVAIGDGSMTAAAMCSTATRNVGVGSSTLSKVLTGDYNVAIGQSSLEDLTSGANNAALGAYSLLDIWAGNYNVAVGHSAARYITNGTNNVALGYQAGQGVNGISNYSYNILIGPGTGSDLLNGSYNILIGKDVEAPTNETNYHLNIGDTIYGNLSTKKIGIGTTAPAAKLEILSASTAPAEALLIRVAGTAPGNNGIIIMDAPNTNNYCGAYMLSETGPWGYLNITSF